MGGRLRIRFISELILNPTDLTVEAVASEPLPADAVVGPVGVGTLGERVAVVHIQLALVLVLTASRQITLYCTVITIRSGNRICLRGEGGGGYIQWTSLPVLCTHYNQKWS